MKLYRRETVTTRGVVTGVRSREVRHFPATVADLVAALRKRGVGEVRQWHGPITLHPKGRPELGDDLPAGVYLVVRIEGEA